MSILEEPSTAENGRRPHTVPVIDRMMDILGALERREDGASITELTRGSGLPRTTVYRILNTLEGHAMVRRGANGAYRLGHRLLGLAAHVAGGRADVDLVAAAQPFMDRLAADLGDSVKLSVLDREGVLVVAVAQGRRAYALSVAPGQRMEPHAGAAGKLLLAALPATELEPWIARPLAAPTAKTIQDPRKLVAELGRIRRQGWARDRGESAPSILAFAAPVTGPDGRVLAALSVPYVAGTAPERAETLRAAVIETARAIGEAITA